MVMDWTVFSDGTTEHIAEVYRKIIEELQNRSKHPEDVPDVDTDTVGEVIAEIHAADYFEDILRPLCAAVEGTYDDGVINTTERIVSILQKDGNLAPELHCKIAGHELEHWPEGDFPKQVPADAPFAEAKRDDSGKLVCVEVSLGLRGQICTRCGFKRTAQEQQDAFCEGINSSPGIAREIKQ